MSFFMMLITSAQLFATNPCQSQQRVFYFNMPIFIGAKVFNDQVEICKVGQKMVGQLEVPNRFKALLENITLNGDELSFSITADEGRGKFQVFYKGTLKENKKYFMGVARLKDDKILGPFVGLSSEKKTKLEIVQ